jgi:hypothetical protein
MEEVIVPIMVEVIVPLMEEVILLITQIIASLQKTTILVVISLLVGLAMLIPQSIPTTLRLLRSVKHTRKRLRNILKISIELVDLM